MELTIQPIRSLNLKERLAAVIDGFLAFLSESLEKLSPRPNIKENELTEISSKRNR